MIKYIKLLNHKGIETLELRNLGQMNVICGKNNSGKSSILEAMSSKDHHAIGKQVDSSIKGLFEPMSMQYGSPNPSQSKKWFSEFIDGIIRDNEIWYETDYELIIPRINSSMKQNPVLKSFDIKIYNFVPLLDKFFGKKEHRELPFLIPPKRFISHKKPIITNEAIQSTGEGILNKLFYLKNQDLKSKDYLLYQSIYTEFEFVTSSNFNIIPKTNNEIELFFKNDTSSWISSNDCGLGLSDALIIICLVYLTNSDTILLEEPENHLHAEYQRKLLDFLKRQNTKQFILATHSNIFLNPTILDSIIYTEYIGTVKVSNETSRARIISSLGYSVSDNLAADIHILTEGISDVPILESLFHWRGIDLKYNIKYWPLCGDMMINLDLDIISEKHTVVSLIDSDPQSNKVREEFKKTCKEKNIKCIQLERYAIENYFTIDAISKAFNSDLSQKIQKILPKKSLKNQLGFSVKSKNYIIIKHMTENDFHDTDLWDFVLEVEKTLKTNVT